MNLAIACRISDHNFFSNNHTTVADVQCTIARTGEIEIFWVRPSTAGAINRNHANRAGILSNIDAATTDCSTIGDIQRAFAFIPYIKLAGIRPHATGTINRNRASSSRLAPDIAYTITDYTAVSNIQCSVTMLADTHSA